MRLIAQQRSADVFGQGRRSGVKTLHIAVVDASRADFDGWPTAESAAHDIELHFVASGRDALRLASQRHVDLWVVNTALPDWDGIDLCPMLRSGASPAPVYLVSDIYSAELERRAYAARASLYGAKPAHHDWLSQWLAHRQRQSPVRCG